MEYLLSTDCLTKKFKRQTAIDNISLHIRQGEIYGLIGKNGAGKTTFLKMISGLSNHGRKCSLFRICSYSGGRKIHRVFRDAISTSYCLWQRDPVPCLPISKCGSKPVDRNFAGGRNFTGCGCVADKHYSPSKRDCRL